MDEYSVRTKEKKIKYPKLSGKRFLVTVLVISLLVSTVPAQNFLQIFAAVATYGRTDDDVWAYKIINSQNRTVSIRPSDLGGMQTANPVIPSGIELQGEIYTVTEIADYAYSDCICADCLKLNKMSLSTAWENEDGNYEGEEIVLNIDKVLVPATITRVGDSAFDSVLLNGITFEENSRLTVIGEWAFSSCTMESIEIPASVTTIDDSAFSYSSLQTITFEDGSQLQRIDEYAFEESELKSITLPESLTQIGECAFLACNLSEISIPASVTTIGKNAFEQNKKLKTVKFAEDGTLKKIQMGAFMGCALTEVTIPASVTDIGICAFGNNSQLETVTFKTASDINKLNTNAFARIPGYDYEEDYIEDMSYESNISVTQVNVENYDVYKWLANKKLFGDDTKIYSKITRVFLEQAEEENVQDNVIMESDMQATIHLDDYISPNQGYHFEGSKFEYSDTLELEKSTEADIEETQFTSQGYPYVIIKANQEANEYEIAYDVNMGETIMESTQCVYGNSVTISTTIPTRKGYEFLGWCKDTTGEGTLYQPGEEVNENFTDENNGVVPLYAIWKEITKKVTIHFSTPKNMSSEYGFEIVIEKDGETIQQHDIGSAQMGEMKFVISGARIGETYLVKCTNYKNDNGKKTYYQTTTKEVTI